MIKCSIFESKKIIKLTGNKKQHINVCISETDVDYNIIIYDII